jgi:hypothetical protein|tara:strand:- start:217 stop:1455 length:1239 start_codon:yes stop_codon:yes gene_type:complete
MKKLKLIWFLSLKGKVLFFGGFWLSILIGCSPETVAESEQVTSVVSQDFLKSLSYQSLHYSNETSNGSLGIEILISIFAPEIDNENVSLKIVKTGDVSATFSLTGGKEFFQSFDEYGTYDLKLYLEKEISLDNVTIIQRDTLIKENAINIRFLDDFSDYSLSDDWSVFPINGNLIGVDNINTESEASIQKSFSGFDADKSIKIDVTYRIYNDNLSKGASLNYENKLGLKVNDQNFYLKSNVNNEQIVRTVNLYNHGGDFDLKLIKYKSMIETPWKIISETAISNTSSVTLTTSPGTSLVTSATLYQLSEASNVLVGYPNFTYVDADQLETIFFNFYYEDTASSSGYTFGLTSDGIEMDGSAFKLTRGPGNYFFKVNLENGIPSRYEATFGVLDESNPYKFDIYIESIELSVP